MTIDPLHTTVEFAATYAMNAIVKGWFRDFSGTLLLDTDDMSNSHVTVRIDAASLESGAEPRDEQLRGEDFLDVETHDELRFESTSIEVVDDNHWHVNGKLSMVGTTRPITLDTRYYGIVEDATGTTRAGFVAETDIQRSDWGMDWNAEQETGVLVSDRVRISLFVSAIPGDDTSDAGVEEEEDEQSEWAPSE